MTRAYAILRLLQQEPMSVDRLMLVGGTSWDLASTTKLVQHLCSQGILTPARDSHRSYCLTGSFDESLRRLQLSEQRESAPARVAPIQPGMPGLRSPGDRLRAAHARAVRERPQREDVLPASALAAVRAQRGGSTHRGRALVVRMGGLGK